MRRLGLEVYENVEVRHFAFAHLIPAQQRLQLLQTHELPLPLNYLSRHCVLPVVAASVLRNFGFKGSLGLCARVRMWPHRHDLICK